MDRNRYSTFFCINWKTQKKGGPKLFPKTRAKKT